MSDSPEEPARAITLALDEAGIAPKTSSMSSLHGTSTEMNDRVETKALKHALGEHAYKIPMSGLKSQIGHAQGACGSAERGGNSDRDGARPGAAHHQSRPSGPGMRSGLRPRRRSQGADRTCSLQLRRIRLEEFGASAKEDGLSIRLVCFSHL